MKNKEDIESIRDAVKTWLERFNSKNETGTFFDLFDPEIIYANGGAPLMQGIEQIRPWYQGAWEMLDARAVVKEEAIIVEGNMGFFVGKFIFQPHDPNAAPGETGRVVIIYRRDENGNWAIVFDMDNRPPDSVPENFAGAKEDYNQ